MTIPVGVSVLTNSNRGHLTVTCVQSFLANCYYRPIILGIFSNGSTDNTLDLIGQLKESMPDAYNIVWRVNHSGTDLGCAAGTNAAHELVRDCQYAIHLESDFIHLTEKESGVSKTWLHQAIQFMETGVCDYLYLRRIHNEQEMMMHWWSQWLPQVTKQEGPFLQCPPFWWSNNPTLRRVQALYDCGTLPLRADLDGAKGQLGWSQPELRASRPTKPWLYCWGMFVHDHRGFTDSSGCQKYGPYGLSTCKYGFHHPSTVFCSLCDQGKNFSDLQNHEQRLRSKLCG